jgi:DNA end-binding protein Ku
LASGRRKRGDTGQHERSPGAPRGMWTGTITFGLVSIPVELFSATRRRSVSLRMLAPDGVPLRRVYVCPEDGDEPLDRDDIVRGYELDSGEIVPIDDEELEKLEPRKTRDIEIQRFVDRHAIPATYFERSYLFAPAGNTSKAYQLLGEVMESTGRAAIASFIMRGKEYLVAITADSGVLRAETMRFPDEIRSVDDIGLPDHPTLARAKVKAIERAIAHLTADSIDVDEMRDDYAPRLIELAQAKHEAGRDVSTAPEVGSDEEPSATIVDLMKVIKQRLGQRAGTRRAGSGNGGARRRAHDLHSASKQELLERARRLDIAGRSRMTRDELIEALEQAVS